MAKYLVMLGDKIGHKVHSLKRAVALSGGKPFISRKVLRGGKRSSVLRKYVVEGRMARCVASKEVRQWRGL
jgi:hypothetical protein